MWSAAYAALVAGLRLLGHGVNEHTLEVMRKYKGEVRQTRDIDLPPDLKTLATTMHRPSPAKQTILVFDWE